MGLGKPTMADIARASGVSQSTVSLVLNQKDSGTIPPGTAERVLAAARELRYSKPRRAPSRRTADKLALVLVSDLTNPYYSYILHELELAAEPGGLRLTCCNTYHQVERETAYLKMAESCGYFAAIFLYPPDDPENANRVNRRLPVFAICDKNSALEIDLIELNNFRAGRIAAEHLLSLGHREIAILSSDPGRSLARSNRVRGAAGRMEENGLQAPVLVPDAGETEQVPGNNASYRIGYALGQRPGLISGGYTALIAINDMVAIGAMDALSIRGMQFPRDYSIIGFDNLLYTGLSRISLTTVDHHTDLLAHAAMDLLLRRTDPAADFGLLSAARFKVECTPQLVVRSSTAPPRP